MINQSAGAKKLLRDLVAADGKLEVRDMTVNERLAANKLNRHGYAVWYFGVPNLDKGVWQLHVTQHGRAAHARLELSHPTAMKPRAELGE